jgi:hypothetical protein
VDASDFTDLEYKNVEVFYRDGLDAYTIIRASAPDGWKDGEEVGCCLFCFGGYLNIILNWPEGLS